MREEVLNLNQQLKDSKTKLINYKTQLEELMMNKEQIDLLMMENKNSNELKSNKELIKNQNIQLQINDEQILQLNKKLKDASIYITQITEQNKKNISEYQIKLNQQDDILMELQKKLKMLSEKNIQLISKDENFEKQQRTDMNLIKQLQNNVENQENQLQIVKVELRNKEDEILLLKQNNLLMEQNIQKRECSQENEEISKIVLQLNQIKEENQNYLNIQSQYKDQVINLNKQNDQMKITIIQQLQSFEQLKEENEILKQQISKIDSQLDSARNEIQLVKTKENGLSTHIDHLNKIYQADQKIKKDLIQNIKNYEQDLTDNKQLNLLQKQHAEDQNIIQQLSQSNQELKFKIEDFQNQQIIDQKIQMDLQDQIQEFNQVFKKQAHNNSLIEIVSPIDNTLSLIEDLKNLKQRVITMASENENLIIMQNQNSESQEIEEKQFFQQYINDVNQFKKELQSNLIQLVQKLQIQINLTDSTCDSSISFEYIYALIKMISQALESQQYQLQNNTLQENINIQNQQTNQYDKSFNLLDYDKNIDDLLCSDEIFISQEKISNQNESTYQQQVHISKQSIIYDNFNNQQQSQIELIQMLLLQASTLEEMLSQNK